LIFVTVGTHHQPFGRLLRALDALDTSEMIVQHGPGKPPAGAARAEEFMPFDAMLAAFREADVVITHAGVGSILCATREGHAPLVVPRRHDLGEHIDDHQVELTRALGTRGSIIAVWDTDALADLVASAPPRRPPVDAVEPPLCGRVRAAIFGEDTPPQTGSA
jgi:UDP-N-acetylglucosamine transferase subunit ALG13